MSCEHVPRHHGPKCSPNRAFLASWRLFFAWVTLITCMCDPGTSEKSRRKQPYQPGLALQSYLLQEAEAVGREAKLRAARGGFRAVSLQHDGVSFLGVPEGGEEAWGTELSVAVTMASGYQVEVEAKRCLSLAAIGIGV